MLFGSFSSVRAGVGAGVGAPEQSTLLHGKHLPPLRNSQSLLQSSAFLQGDGGDEPHGDQTEATSAGFGLVDIAEWKHLEAGGRRAEGYQLFPFVSAKPQEMRLFFLASAGQFICTLHK